MEEDEQFTNYNGEGELKNNVTGEVMLVNIRVTTSYNSKIQIKLTSNEIRPSAIMSRENSEYNLSGNLSNNKKISIPKCYLSQSRLRVGASVPFEVSMEVVPFSEMYIWDSQYPTYEELLGTSGIVKVGLTNFLFNGNLRTPLSSGGFSVDTFKINVESSEISFKQVEHYNEVEKILRKHKRVMLTSEIILEGSINETNPKVNNILWLLSYSQKTLISKFYTKLVVEDNELLEIYPSEKCYDFSNSSFIESSNLRGNWIEQFLNESYENFKTKKDALKLENVTDIICQSELGKVLEAKHLLIVIALELIITSLIDSEEINIVPDEDFISQKSIELKSYLDSQTIAISPTQLRDLAIKMIHPTFKSKLEAINNHFSLGYDIIKLKMIKKNRDSIVHNIRFSDDNQNNLNKHYEASLLLDKIILKIFGYSGDVLNYSNNYNLEKII